MGRNGSVRIVGTPTRETPAREQQATGRVAGGREQMMYNPENRAKRRTAGGKRSETVPVLSRYATKTMMSETNNASLSPARTKNNIAVGDDDNDATEAEGQLILARVDDVGGICSPPTALAQPASPKHAHRHNGNSTSPVLSKQTNSFSPSFPTMPMHHGDVTAPASPSASGLRKRSMSSCSSGPLARTNSIGGNNNIMDNADNLSNTNTNDATQFEADFPPLENPNNNEQHQQQQQQSQPTNNNLQITTQETLMMQQFWRTYDTIIILSIFAVFGIMFRMMSATWFRMELGVVFSEDSALGTTLPLNIWSCFLMGLLCSGREAMGIVHSKVLGGANPYGSGRGILDVGKGAYRGAIYAGKAGINRARGYVRGANGSRRNSDNDITNLPAVTENIEEVSSGNYESSSNTDLHRRRSNEQRAMPNTDVAQSAMEDEETSSRDPLHIHGNNGDHSEQTSRVQYSESIAGLLGLDDEFRIMGSHQNSEDEIREVQLRGLTRRIMASPSLLFFPASKDHMDVMEHYDGDALSPVPSYHSATDDQFEIGELYGDGNAGDIEMSQRMASSSGEDSGEASGRQANAASPSRSSSIALESRQISPPRDNNDTSDNMRLESTTSIEEQVDEMIHSISENVTTFRRIHLLDGWNVDTSPEKMKHIILLGLRVGFCGALSTFSSLNASVIRLLKSKAVGEAIVGYALSVQLGILSYRFGQNLAVYIFVWRCRRETKKDERRGYGLRLRGSSAVEEQLEAFEGSSISQVAEGSSSQKFILPSVRTVATLLFVGMFISLILAVNFSKKHRMYWCSLLFTPFGCLARYWLMNRYNKRLPGFPLGTFSCNLLSCALSGSLGSFLAGNPGPQESIVLSSMVAGFAGSLSTFATFITEILSLIDPIIFKFDGIVYAVITILWAIIIGYLGSQAKNWADEVQSDEV